MEKQSDAEYELMRQMAGQAAAPNNLIAKFSMEPVELSEATKEDRIKKGTLTDDAMGRPIYEEQEFITINIPGDKDNVIFRPVRNVDKVQYGEKYRAFKSNQAQPEVGTPLDKLPFMSKAQVLELNYFGCRTAEQLLSMSDVNGQKIIGWAQLKKRVQDFVDAATGAAPNLKLQAELEKRDNETASLRNMLEQQGKLMKDLQEKLAKQTPTKG